MMADKSKIAWTDATWNVTAGCTKVSPGCQNCYAATMAYRLAAMEVNQYAGVVNCGNWTGKVHCLPGNLEIPARWKKPRRIFVNSMSDLFHPAVPFEFVDRVFAVMAICPQHTFQVLTKRPERMAEYFRFNGRQVAIMDALERVTGAQIPGTLWPLPNVWLGTSVENQTVADKRIPSLLRCPAAVRYLSCEPLLGELDLGNGLYSEHDRAAMDSQYLSPIDGNSTARIDWVIVGGESGPDARPMHPAWVLSLRDQCEEDGTPFYFKQWGEWCPGEFGTDVPDCLGKRVDDANYFHYFDDPPYKTWRVGKRAAGCELDGREWHEFPQPHPGEEL